MSDYITVIGLEIHAELSVLSKVFCSCASHFGGNENTRVCPQCGGFPGALPRINKAAVELAVKAGLAFGSDIKRYSAFDRKNYCYPDLPKAYQITQFFSPIALGGSITVCGENINLERIHIEEDAGKLTHPQGENLSLADYNRCGVPLIEIVTAPEIHSGPVARKVAEQIALTLKYAGVCDGKMEQGSLRCDVNISLKRPSDTVFGTRTEIKNLNSFRAIERAVKAEEMRQKRILEAGGKVLRQTLHFDDLKNELTVLRTKEGEDDYRYFPEPDLPAVILEEEYIDELRSSLPELPDAKKKRYTECFNLNEADVDLIILNPQKAVFFEAATTKTQNIKTLTSLIITELPRIEKDFAGTKSRLTPDSTAAVCNMVQKGMLSPTGAKEVFRILYKTGDDPEKIARENGMIIKNNQEEIRAAIKNLFDENKEALDEYKKGSFKLFGFFMGKLTKVLGKAYSPALIKNLLEEELNNL